ncbi:MAG: chemotaxis protein CheB [Bacteroidota bacterium]
MAKIVDQQYIIAIGASSGGLEAISAFFDYTPLDSVSYIIIQHLSADFKSQMAQLLDSHSKLQVLEAIENVDIMSNTVYLIPSTKFMIVENGRLILSDKKDEPRPHMTINYFFSSLAKERGNKAIAIILSGTGDDGAKGIQEIKDAGGVVMVQDPGTATFKGMPDAAIATRLR